MGIRTRLFPRHDSFASSQEPLKSQDDVRAHQDGQGSSSPPVTVLLTGSTGNLGAYLLHELLQYERVEWVICLNRSDDAGTRQKSAQLERGLDTELDRVTFMKADFAAPKLGLAEDLYENLIHRVSLIIHNAWPVDFNRSFKSFTPSIDGVRNLIALSRSPPPPPRPGPQGSPPTPTRTSSIPILFISSIAAASNWTGNALGARVPEAELLDWKLARTGYGQSKLLSERLLAHAARDGSTSVSIVRVGQLAGPVKGPSAVVGWWPDREWLPSLIRSSAALQALPQDLGPADEVDWVPVDIAAVSIADLAGELYSRSNAAVPKVQEASSTYLKARKPRPHRGPAHEGHFFHLVNPNSISWSELLPTLQLYMPPETSLLPFSTWVDQLKRTSTADYDRVPAIKLLTWFEHLQDRAIRSPAARSPQFDTSLTLHASHTLATLSPVQAAWMELWCRQWGFVKQRHRGDYQASGAVTGTQI